MTVVRKTITVAAYVLYILLLFWPILLLLSYRFMAAEGRFWLRVGIIVLETVLGASLAVISWKEYKGYDKARFLVQFYVTVLLFVVFTGLWFWIYLIP
jgi:hypothetical protein